MNITYLGESCFLLSQEDKNIIIDPYAHIDIPIEKNFNILFTNDNTEANFTYSYDSFIKKDSFFIDDIEIDVLPSYCDNLKGSKRGENKIYIIKLEKTSLCHLGWLGHIPRNDILDKIKNIDILMIPIGGNFTIDYKTASKLCKIISPKNILPMNYTSRGSLFPLKCIDNFITEMKNTKTIPSSCISLDKSLLKNDKKVLVLSN